MDGDISLLLAAGAAYGVRRLKRRGTIQMIRENVYLQYFLGFYSFTSKSPFDFSLFMEIRKRLGIEQLNRINDVIYQAAMGNREAGSGGTEIR